MAGEAGGGCPGVGGEEMNTLDLTTGRIRQNTDAAEINDTSGNWVGGGSLYADLFIRVFFAKLQAAEILRRLKDNAPA